jgi:exopolysaccharide biosynthesis protein
MKRILLILFMFSAILQAQVRLDTLSCRFIGPGAIYTKIKAPSVPWDIDVLRVDLKNPYIKVETIKARDRYIGRETTSSMAKRKTTEGHWVIGAVNGDFYKTGNGQPINVQIEKGEFIRTPAPKLSTIGFDADNKPMMSFVSFSGKAIASNGTSNAINNVNEVRGTNQLLIYNSYMGDSTGTNQYGTEALIHPVKSWIVNDTVICIVDKIEINKGNMPITPGMVVLSGNGTAASFISNNFKVGDTIKVYQGITPGLAKIKEMIGGYPKIVNDGKNYADQGYKDEGGPDHTYTREPRTAAGFSADSTYLYLITLDGRGVSLGATLPELADVMLRVGVAYGINFDGGGSTTMLIRGNIMNTPSDGSERQDANCLSVVSSAPFKPDSLKRFAFTYKYNKFNIYSVDRIKLSVYANDVNDNPSQIDSSSLSFSLSSGLGVVDNSGMFTASKLQKSGYIYTKYKGFTDSSFVSIIPVTKIQMLPKTSLIDATTPLKLSLKGYTQDNTERTLQYEDLQWSVSDTSVVSISKDGQVIGKKEGKAKIVTTFLNGISDSIDVTVQIGRGTTLSDNMESSWTLSGSKIDLTLTKLTQALDSKTEGTSSLKADYTYTYDPSSYSMIYLNKTVPFYGVPDSVLFDVLSQDTSSHKMFLVVKNDANKSFRVDAVKDVTKGSGKFTTYSFYLKNNTPLDAGVFTYPVKLSKIVLQLAYTDSNRVSGKTYSGTIYFDNLRLKYPLGPTSAVEDNENALAQPKDFSLKQNYPNPFNPSTIIEFATTSETKDLTTTLKVYDLLGREVATLLNQRLSSGLHKVVWNAGNMPSGVYFYRLQSGNYVETKKMMLVR